MSYRNYYRQIVSAIPEPLVLLDSDLKILLTNRAFCRNYSTTSKDCEGKSIYEINKGRWNIPQLKEILEHRLKKHATVKDFQFDTELPRRGERIILLNAQTLRPDSGGDTKVLLVLEDITKRRQIENKLIYSELRYRRLFETAQDGILILAAKSGAITDVNPFLIDMLGYSKEELLGKKLWEIGFFKDSAASHDAFQTLTDVGYVRYEDLPLERKDGTSMEVEFVSNIYGINGEQVIQCNIRDITDRKKLEQALVKIKKSLEVKVKLRTRELKELTRKLQSLAAQLTLVEGHERQLIAEEIHNGIGQELTLANLELSRLLASKSFANVTDKSPIVVSLKRIQRSIIKIEKEARDFIFEISPPSLYTIGLSAALGDFLRRVQERHGIATSFMNNGDAEFIDENMRILLFQMVRELVVNIIKHAHAKFISLNLSKFRDNLVISVSDDGVGFDINLVKNNTKQGFGLFSISERLVILNGTLEVDSKIGQGTTATIIIPPHRNKTEIC